MTDTGDKLGRFMNAFTAASQLLSRAGQNGFFVEYVCLATSVVDATLRMGLILQHQINTRSKDFPDKYLFQPDDDKIISERQIYADALREGVIDEPLFEQLEELYKKRNRVVHRYVISDISTNDVLEIGIEYEKLIPEVSKHVEQIECRQIELGVGMTIAGAPSPKEEMEALLDEMSSEKHRNPILDQALKQRKASNN
jgi:hypothetical protein